MLISLMVLIISLYFIPCVCVCVCVLSRFGCVQLLVTPWTVTCQAPLSMGFPSQEYWSGLPFPFPGYLPAAGIQHKSPTLAGGFFTAELPGKPFPCGSSCFLAPNSVLSFFP